MNETTKTQLTQLFMQKEDLNQEIKSALLSLRQDAEAQGLLDFLNPTDNEASEMGQFALMQALPAILGKLANAKSLIPDITRLCSLKLKVDAVTDEIIQILAMEAMKQ